VLLPGENQQAVDQLQLGWIGPVGGHQVKGCSYMYSCPVLGVSVPGISGILKSPLEALDILQEYAFCDRETS